MHWQLLLFKSVRGCEKEVGTVVCPNEMNSEKRREKVSNSQSVSYFGKFYEVSGFLRQLFLIDGG